MMRLHKKLHPEIGNAIKTKCAWSVTSCIFVLRKESYSCGYFSFILRISLNFLSYFTSILTWILTFFVSSLDFDMCQFKVRKRISLQWHASLLSCNLVLQIYFMWRIASEKNFDVGFTIRRSKLLKVEIIDKNNTL